MIDPDAPVATDRLEALRRDAVGTLGLFFDPQVVERIASCIIDKVQAGAVEDGIPYRDLVRDSGAPSWVAHPGLLASVLALVSLRSWDEDEVLVSALTRATKNKPPPTDEFCGLLETLGLVTSRHHREECLEMWDYHWKKVISRLESRLAKTGSPRL